MKENEERKATIEHLVSDMGNGCALCSLCTYNLNHGDTAKIIPNICPGCGAHFIDSTIWISSGGSDF